MGIFSFLSTSGKKVLGLGDNSEAIKNEIETSFEALPVEGLVTAVEGGKVTLAGLARDIPTREKVILIAGNVEGVDSVDAEQLLTPELIASSNLRDEPEPNFYTIEKGDTLWSIAENFYKNGSKYTKIVEANLEVIKDADKIYPGQAIRIPSLTMA
ncbi:MAG TPA: peptidoglycan-binding protein LysM [Sulfurovum sp.]|jgi:nucleoid-associated protein YgaU|nr:MAG: peptidoglycan-binding protein LysM [Sulfurovum sp. 35-42-20]OYZ26686.1 MAG: peptidoglycan-binding protein LysM [Sulfurovum sp. 16-42-52]OYZ49360.1 MAG: peptidoglycan-binding protein LysM [Sulfurovum sp. 24-42-9]OZA47030.1 MAG: peptidoglycan-binding protein LysM [Sulfurovum sp. 17-42-90]OZA60097.1 MAG: peptidoglycan-binding protein LysM [Sulfurovum sp. 39-42-12]HQR73430.1 peptidoglycan-binding protein LysM [Sulfurovum sp.]